MDRVQLKAQGKAAMKSNFGMCILAAFLIAFSMGGSAGSAGGGISQSANNFKMQDMSSEQMAAFLAVMAVVFAIVMIFVILGTLFSAFIIQPLAIGGHSYFVANLSGKPESNLLGIGYKNNWGRNGITMLLVNVYTFLWTLLFIIPGIIAAYSYRFVPYILAENPDIKANDAIKLSKQMIDGHKWEAFVLDLSFIGWNILGIFTFGILNLVYVNPYYYSTCAAFYTAVKGTAQPMTAYTEPSAY